jgi:alpha-glucosidase
VVLNFGHEPRRARLPEGVARARILISTALDREDEQVGPEVALRPDEGLILELAQ